MKHQEVLDIINGNKLLVEFMGYKFHKKVMVEDEEIGGYYQNVNIYSKNEIPVIEHDDQIFLDEKKWYDNNLYLDSISGNLEYDNDWNRIIEVVNEIFFAKDIYGFDIVNENVYNDMQKCFWKKDIKSLFIFCVHIVKILNILMNAKGHPMTCCGGHKEYSQFCERQNNISEGILTEINGEYVCPCGYYKQKLKYNE